MLRCIQIKQQELKKINHYILVLKDSRILLWDIQTLSRKQTGNAMAKKTKKNSKIKNKATKT